MNYEIGLVYLPPICLLGVFKLANKEETVSGKLESQMFDFASVMFWESSFVIKENDELSVSDGRYIQGWSATNYINNIDEQDSPSSIPWQLMYNIIILIILLGQP